MTRYAELHCLSNFTFLRGASHPAELVHQAYSLGYRALALTDECSISGVVRAHVAARKIGLQLIIGSEFTLNNGDKFVLLATNKNGYRQLTRLITLARRRAPKGEYRLTVDDLRAKSLSDCLSLVVCDPSPTPMERVHAKFQAISDHAKRFKCLMSNRVWLALEQPGYGTDEYHQRSLETLSENLEIPIVATGNVHMHCRARQPLQDTLTAIRHQKSILNIKHCLAANAERHLRSKKILKHLYRKAALNHSIQIADQCHFSLDELDYQYPSELIPDGLSATQYLRQLVEHGVTRRWPGGAIKKVLNQIEHELSLIAELNYEGYFLTVYDIVCFARSHEILCQGRGSAANSAVCFALGITEVDPARMEMLFERFVSRERNEPPDIDVDFEHERREEVMQYVYRRYGRHRAALVSAVITYRPRSAIRDVGRALGLSQDQIDCLAKNIGSWHDKKIVEQRIKDIGLDPKNPVLNRVLKLAEQLIGFPRHLSQHSGGFVISHEPLCDLVPIENAAMAERTIIQWDKNDIDNLGLLKVDCLALGMLTAIHNAFDLFKKYRGTPLTMANIPAEDPDVYKMISRADTVGVFQIESRAQMVMLPRLQPRCFYDLVIEVAIVRPGPIQGDMVHPYLRRRNGQEAISYPSEAVREVLDRTLGVPIFQEQVIKLAMVAAGFSPGEADGLRRDMAAWKQHGGLNHYEEKLTRGMIARGYSPEFAKRIYQQILGFGEYGFPESHAASFALLVYVSAWLKCHEPAIFTCALLNSQPMGFYSASQLIQDVKRHGVQVLSVDVTQSEWDCTIEENQSGLDIRLGLRLIKHLSRSGAMRLTRARRQTGFTSLEDLRHRADLDQRDLQALAGADALSNLIRGHRKQAGWVASGVEKPSPIFPALKIREALPMLRAPQAGESVCADYASLGLTLGPHPLALLRDNLGRLGALSSQIVNNLEDGCLVHTAGIVTVRQKPSSAKNVTFISLEDENGSINLIVWQALAAQQHQTLIGSRLLGVYGKVQKEGQVTHVIAHRLKDYTHLLGDLTTDSRDFQ